MSSGSKFSLSLGIGLETFVELWLVFLESTGSTFLGFFAKGCSSIDTSTLLLLFEATALIFLVFELVFEETLDTIGVDFSIRGSLVKIT